MENAESQTNNKYCEAKTKLLECEESIIGLKGTIRQLESQLQESKEVSNASLSISMQLKMYISLTSLSLNTMCIGQKEWYQYLHILKFVSDMPRHANRFPLWWIFKTLVVSLRAHVTFVGDDNSLNETVCKVAYFENIDFINKKINYFYLFRFKVSLVRPGNNPILNKSCVYHCVIHLMVLVMRIFKLSRSWGFSFVSSDLEISILDKIKNPWNPIKGGAN